MGLSVLATAVTADPDPKGYCTKHQRDWPHPRYSNCIGWKKPCMIQCHTMKKRYTSTERKVGQIFFKECQKCPYREEWKIMAGRRRLLDPSRLAERFARQLAK